MKAGDIVYQGSAEVGRANFSADCSGIRLTRDEAVRDAIALVDAYDPEWQKKHPGCVQAIVTTYRVDDVDDDGEFGAGTSIACESV